MDKIMWAQILNILNGVCLMIFPWAFKLEKLPSDNLHIVGPVIAMFAIIALTECTRNVRWLNIPLGSWLVISPIFISYNSIIVGICVVLIGVLVVVFSLVKGKIKHRFEGGWRGLLN